MSPSQNCNLRKCFKHLIYPGSRLGRLQEYIQAGSEDRTSEGSRRATGEFRLIFDSGEREYGRGTTQRNQRSGLGNDGEAIPRGR